MAFYEMMKQKSTFIKGVERGTCGEKKGKAHDSKPTLYVKHGDASIITWACTAWLRVELAHRHLLMISLLMEAAG